MTFQNSAMRFAKQGEFFLRKNAPSIMTYVGVGGFVATVGLAIRATSKADDIAPKLREQIKDVKSENELTESMTDREQNQRVGRVYLETGVTILKIYAPTLAVGSASIILVLAGHGIMLKRQAQLAAVYAALDASYKAYRARVRDEVGAEKEDEIYRRPNMRALDQDELGEDGQTHAVDLGNVLPSPYARFFDPTSQNWVKTPEYNMIFLRAQEKWANDRLRMYGYLFLNEVYEALGLERSQGGQMVGWKLDKDGYSEGDGFVSFGLADMYDENSRAFVNGLENVVLLDFNVDGVIRI
jgi:uncharacterized membrane protein